MLVVISRILEQNHLNLVGIRMHFDTKVRPSFNLGMDGSHLNARNCLI